MEWGLGWDSIPIQGVGAHNNKLNGVNLFYNNFIENPYFHHLCCFVNLLAALINCIKWQPQTYLKIHLKLTN